MCFAFFMDFSLLIRYQYYWSGEKNFWKLLKSLKSVNVYYKEQLCIVNYLKEVKNQSFHV